MIVVGAVAELELLSEKEKPLAREGTEKPGRRRKDSLAGVTVGVTGTAHFVEKLSAALLEKGVSAWDMGFLEVCPCKTPLPDLEACGWLVFTSPNGVRVFLDKMKRERKDLRSLCGKRIAVIGPGTAAAFEKIGVYADYMPEIYDAAHLAQGLAEKILKECQDRGKDGSLAVFLRAREGSEALPCIFAEEGISFLESQLYGLEIQEDKRAAVIEKSPIILFLGRREACVLTSRAWSGRAL